MRMQFHVIHKNDNGNAFPLNNVQIQHEYSTFGQMLALYFKAPAIEASCAACKSSEEGVILTVEGSVAKDVLIESVRAFLLKLNAIPVAGRVGRPNFVAAIVIV